MDYPPSVIDMSSRNKVKCASYLSDGEVVLSCAPFMPSDNASLQALSLFTAVPVVYAAFCVGLNDNGYDLI